MSVKQHQLIMSPSTHHVIIDDDGDGDGDSDNENNSQRISIDDREHYDSSSFNDLNSSNDSNVTAVIRDGAMASSPTVLLQEVMHEAKKHEHYYNGDVDGDSGWNKAVADHLEEVTSLAERGVCGDREAIETLAIICGRLVLEKHVVVSELVSMKNEVETNRRDMEVLKDKELDLAAHEMYDLEERILEMETVHNEMKLKRKELLSRNELNSLEGVLESEAILQQNLFQLDNNNHDNGVIVDENQSLTKQFTRLQMFKDAVISGLTATFACIQEKEELENSMDEYVPKIDEITMKELKVLAEKGFPYFSDYNLNVFDEEEAIGLYLMRSEKKCSKDPGIFKKFIGMQTYKNAIISGLLKALESSCGHENFIGQSIYRDDVVFEQDCYGGQRKIASSQYITLDESSKAALMLDQAIAQFELLAAQCVHARAIIKKEGVMNVELLDSMFDHSQFLDGLRSKLKNTKEELDSSISLTSENYPGPVSFDSNHDKDWIDVEKKTPYLSSALKRNRNYSEDDDIEKRNDEILQFAENLSPSVLSQINSFLLDPWYSFSRLVCKFEYHLASIPNGLRNDDVIAMCSVVRELHESLEMTIMRGKALYNLVGNIDTEVSTWHLRALETEIEGESKQIELVEARANIDSLYAEVDEAYKLLDLREDIIATKSIEIMQLIEKNENLSQTILLRQSEYEEIGRRLTVDSAAQTNTKIISNHDDNQWNYYTELMIQEERHRLQVELETAHATINRLEDSLAESRDSKSLYESHLNERVLQLDSVTKTIRELNCRISDTHEGTSINSDENLAINVRVDVDDNRKNLDDDSVPDLQSMTTYFNTCLSRIRDLSLLDHELPQVIENELEQLAIDVQRMQDFSRTNAEALESLFSYVHSLHDNQELTNDELTSLHKILKTEREEFNEFRDRERIHLDEEAISDIEHMRYDMKISDLHRRELSTLEEIIVSQRHEQTGKIKALMKTNADYETNIHTLEQLQYNGHEVVKNLKDHIEQLESDRERTKIIHDKKISELHEETSLLLKNMKSSMQDKSEHDANRIALLSSEVMTAEAELSNSRKRESAEAALVSDLRAAVGEAESRADAALNREHEITVALRKVEAQVAACEEHENLEATRFYELNVAFEVAEARAAAASKRECQERARADEVEARAAVASEQQRQESTRVHELVRAIDEAEARAAASGERADEAEARAAAASERECQETRRVHELERAIDEGEARAAALTQDLKDMEARAATASERERHERTRADEAEARAAEAGELQRHETTRARELAKAIDEAEVRAAAAIGRECRETLRTQELVVAIDEANARAAAACERERCETAFARELVATLEEVKARGAAALERERQEAKRANEAESRIAAYSISHMNELNAREAAAEQKLAESLDKAEAKASESLIELEHNTNKRINELIVALHDAENRIAISFDHERKASERANELSTVVLEVQAEAASLMEREHIAQTRVNQLTNDIHDIKAQLVEAKERESVVTTHANQLNAAVEAGEVELAASNKRGSMELERSRRDVELLNSDLTSLRNESNYRIQALEAERDQLLELLHDTAQNVDLLEKRVETEIDAVNEAKDTTIIADKNIAALQSDLFNSRLTESDLLQQLKEQNNQILDLRSDLNSNRDALVATKAEVVVSIRDSVDRGLSQLTCALEKHNRTMLVVLSRAGKSNNMEAMNLSEWASVRTSLTDAIRTFVSFSLSNSVADDNEYEPLHSLAVVDELVRCNNELSESLSQLEHEKFHLTNTLAGAISEIEKEKLRHEVVHRDLTRQYDNCSQERSKFRKDLELERQRVTQIESERNLLQHEWDEAKKRLVHEKEVLLASLEVRNKRIYEQEHDLGHVNNTDTIFKATCQQKLSLIDQKNYLLSVLAGYQSCEVASLKLIQNMGVSLYSGAYFQRSKSLPLSRFKSIALAVLFSVYLKRAPVHNNEISVSKESMLLLNHNSTRDVVVHHNVPLRGLVGIRPTWEETYGPSGSKNIVDPELRAYVDSLNGVIKRLRR